MKQLFKFSFYGLNCSAVSNNAEFMQLLRNKFGSYKKNVTEALLSGKVKISFQKNTLTSFLPAGNNISNTTVIDKDIIQITHRYLTTSAIVQTKFKKKSLASIDISFKSTLIFSVVNMFLFNTLQRQLFQQIIKLYVEQTLYWYVALNKGLQCIHASAAEKNGKVLVFAGLNGVGKSTLVQLLIKNYDYHFFADNYLLIDDLHAYFSPDTIRLDQHSLSMLGKTAEYRYGFNKFTTETINSSLFKKAPVSKMYFVSQGKQWQKTKQSRSKFWEKLLVLLSINGEMVALAPVAQYKPQGFSGGNIAKKAACFDLVIGINKPFKENYV